MKKIKKNNAINNEAKKNEYIKLDSSNFDQNDLEMEMDDDEDLQFYLQHHLKKT